VIHNPDGYIYVYMVRCADGSYYAGITRGSLEVRISQHNTGHFGGYTAAGRSFWYGSRISSG